MHAQDTISFFMRQDFDAAIRLPKRLGAAIGAKGKGSFSVRHLFLLELIFSLADGRDFGMCITKACLPFG